MAGSKSFFGVSRVKFLGHQISADGLSMDPSRTEVIRTYPRPVNSRQIKAWLGLCSYFKRFICNYSTISEPLRRLLSKSEPFRWSDEQELAFETLKDRLCNSPILAHPDINKPMIISTDASKHGLGYILSQLDSLGRERVISYNGRATRSYEKNYTATELECAALIQAIVTYSHYLYLPFTVVTDHISLKSLQDLKLGSSRLVRWSLMLQQ